MAQSIEDENIAIISFFKHEEEDFQFNGISSLVKVKKLTKMPNEDFQEFIVHVLKYCRENLAKVDAFIPSPYVKK